MAQVEVVQDKNGPCETLRNDEKETEIECHYLDGEIYYHDSLYGSTIVVSGAYNFALEMDFMMAEYEDTCEVSYARLIGNGMVIHDDSLSEFFDAFLVARSNFRSVKEFGDAVLRHIERALK